MWWLLNPERLKREIVDIDALRLQEPWLVATKQRLLPGLKFVYEFDIRINDETIPLRLEYPGFFPDTPPVVFPREDRRLSGHQYGKGGELCLEFRSDNWDPSYTGAMLMQSAYRLLSGESPAANVRADVPSAHALSVGQEVRRSEFRFLVVQRLIDFAASFPVAERLEINVRERVVPIGKCAAHIDHVGPVAAPIWTDNEFPTQGGCDLQGTIFRVASLSDLPSISNYAELANVVDSITPSSPLRDSSISQSIVFSDAVSARMYYVYYLKGSGDIIAYDTLHVPPSVNRLPETYGSLSSKKIGIIGCGSLGSKVAVILARCGVRNYVLVDGDIMLPGNIVRNELAGESIGAMKVDAVSTRLKLISKEMNVSIRRVSLGAQEASGTTASVLDELAACDLLIDSTADPQAFNFVAAVARNSLRPMLWSEVFAGGVGGFVARLRPNIEPPPHAARQQCLAWCRDQGKPWLGRDRHYEARVDNLPPLIADDSDVSIIAAHTAKMAVDVLVRPGSSLFPHPAYMIGFSAEWIFSEPFDVRPIDLAGGQPWRDLAERTLESKEFLDSFLAQIENES